MRIYFWIQGADPDRFGGPWWYRDFEWDTPENHQRLDRFLSDVRPFLHAYAITQGDVFQHLAWNIKPPANAQVIFL